MGPAGEGFMWLEPAVPENVEFATKMETIGKEPTLASPQSYDAVYIYADVFNKVGTKGEDIKNALYDIDYTGGVSAKKITLDENGDLIGADYMVKKAVDGEMIIVE